jgi:hypothetical protein
MSEFYQNQFNKKRDPITQIDKNYQQNRATPRVTGTDWYQCTKAPKTDCKVNTNQTSTTQWLKPTTQATIQVPNGTSVPKQQPGAQGQQKGHGGNDLASLVPIGTSVPKLNKEISPAAQYPYSIHHKTKIQYNYSRAMKPKSSKN